MGPHLYVGLPGLATDTQTVHARLKFRQNLFELKEGTRMSPKVFSSMVSNMLYEKRCVFGIMTNLFEADAIFLKFSVVPFLRKWTDGYRFWLFKT